MEATSTLTRSISLTARFPSPAQLCPLSAAASCRALPLRRARSDSDRSAVVLRHSPILEAYDQEKAPPEGLLDSAGRNGGGCDMGEYYRRVLRVDPENPLLLRNYGRYLQEVEGDLADAEGCYARALLACPGDADLLSLYGRVIWEARQDKERAAEYLERAVRAAPDDCYVLGSYASFLWDTEEDEDDDDVQSKEEIWWSAAPPALVPAC